MNRHKPRNPNRANPNIQLVEVYISAREQVYSPPKFTLSRAGRRSAPGLVCQVFNSHLEYLSLTGNQLSGEIPPDFGKIASLTVLDLSDDQLSGCVPSSLQGQLERAYTDLGGLPFC